MSDREHGRALKGTFLAAVFVCCFLVATAHGQAPDLTTTDLASIDTSRNYNLGPTGLRGWIHVERTYNGIVYRGIDGSMTDIQPYQVLVTSVGTNTPASGVLQTNDVLLGVNTGFNNLPVPLFTNDTRHAIGLAIGAAEAADGWMNFRVWRAGVTSDVSIRLFITNLAYSATAPYNCPKSALILSNAVHYLPHRPLDGYTSLGGKIVGLAMLASGSTNFLPRLETFARSVKPQAFVDFHAWSEGYAGVFLSEYYLKTGDTNVLPALNGMLMNIANGTDRYGAITHYGPSLFNSDGSYNGTAGGYGPINNVSLACTIAMVLGRKSLVEAGRPVDPALDAAITRGTKYFGYFTHKGEIPYGEHDSLGAMHVPNGKFGQAAILFAMLNDQPASTEYWTRLGLASFKGREEGHGGSGLNYVWEALGVNVGGTNAIAGYVSKIRWHLDLERRADGSFVYDGQEGYGPSAVSDYWTAPGYNQNDYYGIDPVAFYILMYALPLKQIYITGRDANPVHVLSADKVTNAIWAASITANYLVMTTNQLMAALSEYDPMVRQYSAQELGKRAGVSVESITNLIGSTNAGLRASACMVLGKMLNTNGVEALVQCLCDPDVSVRAFAAKALLELRAVIPDAVASQVNPMLTAFVSNATDPSVIDWRDPWQQANALLNETLFDSYYGNPIGPSLAAADRSLLFPALRVGLKHPAGITRCRAADFIRQYLSVTDIQELAQDLIDCATTPTLADPMFRSSGRREAISALANYKLDEAVPVAMAMLNPPWNALYQGDAGENESPCYALNAIAAYGDSVRYLLPKLNQYLVEWGSGDERYGTLRDTINAISAATDSPVITHAFAVADSQVVSTTNAVAITLTGSSWRTNPVLFLGVTAPKYGILTGTPPNLTYTPFAGYSAVDHFTFQVTDTVSTSEPATVSILIGSAGTGIRGDYFNNADFTGTKVTRLDPQISFDWETGAPTNSMGSDTFSARWRGLLMAPESGEYMFSALVSDGARLYVNGTQVIDDWSVQEKHWKDGAKLHLTGGQMYELSMDYFENTGDATAKLKWSGPSFGGPNGVIVGTQWLYDTAGMTNLSLLAYAQSVKMVQNSSRIITLGGSAGATSFQIVTGPSHGTLSGTPPTVTYTPASNYNGADMFMFRVSDGVTTSASAAVSINVLAGNEVVYSWKDPADGAWSVAGNWTNSVAPAAAGRSFYRLNFSPSGAYTVTNNLNSNFAVNQLSFSADVTVTGNQVSYANNGASLPQISQNSSGTVKINAPLRLSATTTIGGIGGGSIELGGLISGPGGLIYNSPGQCSLLSANTYAGGTIINAGMLITGYGISNVLGTGPVTLNGGTLQVLRIDASNPLTVNGGMLWADGGWGGDWNGPITLNGNLTVTTPGYDGFRFNGNISGTGGLITDPRADYGPGGGVVFLNGTNTYSGPTIIQVGKIYYSKSVSVAPGLLDIRDGAVANLDYTGTRTISWLRLGGVDKPAGVYGSLTSDAANKDSHFSGGEFGDGTITVSPAIGFLTNSPATKEFMSSNATLNATLTGNNVPYTVLVYWGAVNGGTNAASWTHSAVIGTHTVGGLLDLSREVKGLSVGTVYYFAFRGTNAFQSIWATNVQSFVVADSDSDGMPDLYEMTQNFNPTQQVDAAVDSDGDRHSNMQEYLAGTDPWDFGSVLKISSLSFSIGMISLNFDSIAGKFYDIQRNSNLVVTGGWQTIVGNVAGNGGGVTVQDPAATSKSNFFYRVLLH